MLGEFRNCLLLVVCGLFVCNYSVNYAASI